MTPRSGDCGTSTSFSMNAICSSPRPPNHSPPPESIQSEPRVGRRIGGAPAPSSPRRSKVACAPPAASSYWRAICVLQHEIRRFSLSRSRGSERSLVPISDKNPRGGGRNSAMQQATAAPWCAILSVRRRSGLTGPRFLSIPQSFLWRANEVIE